MKQIRHEEYQEIRRRIDRSACGAVYPCSVAEQYQGGDIFADEQTVLFWHDCGFAHIFGACSDAALDFVYTNFLRAGSRTERRFVLFTDDAAVVRSLRDRGEILTGKRYFYAYPDSCAPAIRDLPEPLRIAECGADCFETLDGRITPRFSWRDPAQFGKYGRAFCVMDGDTPAAWAFSAAVSAEETDIGVETSPDYQKMGLGTVAAASMIRYVLAQQKRPVWACDAANTASQKLAEKLGFVRTGECTTIRKGS